MKLGLGITQRKGKRRGTSTSPFLWGNCAKKLGHEGEDQFHSVGTTDRVS